jgi:hypothetical protein
MDDVIQYQRIASGYVPGLSEVGTPVPVVPPSTTAAAAPKAEWCVFYGASLGATPLYAGFLNSQVFRIIITSAGALADADFDFSIERVIDPLQEP